MKTRKKNRKPAPLTPDAQRRLIAYTAAASLGAFFAQNAEGQVTQSQGLAPYPRTMSGTSITNGFSIDGTAIQFKFASHSKAHSNNWPKWYTDQTYTSYAPKLSYTNSVDLYAIPVYNGKHYGADLTNWWATLGGGTNWGPATNWWLLRTNGVANTNTFILNPGGQEGIVPALPKTAKATPPAYGYPVPWTVGSIIDSNAWSPVYQQYGDIIANYWGANAHMNSEGVGFSNNVPLGFTFWSLKSGTLQRYYGYMDIQITGNAGPPGYTVIVTNMYYNATPNAGIVAGAVPSGAATIKVTSITTGPGNSVTINFTSSDNAASSAFTLQKSSAIGSAASWSTDSSAVISGSAGVYKAVTTGATGVRYYRINE